MDTSIERRTSQFRRDIGLAIAIALAVQGAFTAALALPEFALGATPRLIVGLSSVPLSALCGTLFFRRRHRARPGAHLMLLFFSLVVIIVAAGFLFSAITGNYDLP
jgi:FtsH-binding integral membrane protein